MLVGDINGHGVVNLGDTVFVRNAAGDTVNGGSFRNDVNADGLMNAGDSIFRDQSPVTLFRCSANDAYSPGPGVPDRCSLNAVSRVQVVHSISDWAWS